MDTLKTAVIVVLLLAVLYGAYMVLNRPETPAPPKEVAWHAHESTGPLQIELGASPGATDAAPGDLTSAAPAMVGGATPPPSDSPVTAPDLFENPPGSADQRQTDDTAAAAEPPADVAEAAPPVSASLAPPTATSSQAAPLERGNAGVPDRAGANLEPPADPAVAEQPAAESGAAPLGTAEQSAGPGVGASIFERDMRVAQTRIDDKKWYEALLTLSRYYGSPDLSDEDNRRLLDLLDPLAGKVVFSTEHLMEPPYQVRRGETLLDIAKQYDVPWQLLANINGIEDPEVLTPGSELKVLRGPFRAEVDLAGSQLTLFIGRLYAGRFDITVGADPTPQPGTYYVKDKQAGRTYYAGDGRTIPAGDPSNPYGQTWIDLGGDVCIHGSPAKSETDLGCISLSPIDASDVRGILSRGSSVLIRR